MTAEQQRECVFGRKLSNINVCNYSSFCVVSFSLIHIFYKIHEGKAITSFQNFKFLYEKQGNT